MTALTYAGIIDRLKVLNSSVDHHTLQLYNRHGIIEKPAYPTPGSAALFTAHAPLQAYAAKQMALRWIKTEKAAEARLIVEYVEAKFAPVKHQKGGANYKTLGAKLLRDSDLITLLSGKSDGAFHAHAWAQLKANAALKLYNYGMQADPGTWLMDAEETDAYGSIENNLSFPGRVITFLQKYRGQLVTLANGFDLE